MRFRWLMIFPFVWGALFLLLGALITDPGAHAVFMRTEIEMAKALALLGALAAAFAHQPGEHLRRAWMLVGLGYALFLFRDLRSIPFVAGAVPETLMEPLAAVLVVGGNISIFFGIYLLARTWKMAGLTLPGSRGDRMIVTTVVTLLAVLLVGPGILRSGGLFFAGEWTAAAGFISSIGDLAVLILLAPLLMTMWALRKGMFVWPWKMLCAGAVGWMFYDAILSTGAALGLSAAGVVTFSELARGVACAFYFSAGMAQRSIATGGWQVRADTPQPEPLSAAP
ncbi:MAG: hypothetical protein WBX15_11690 [Thermoanaerobaculia bacterium]